MKVTSALSNSSDFYKFIKDGGDIHSCDENGYTLAHWAILSRQTSQIPSMIKRLITLNIDLSAKTNSGSTVYDERLPILDEPTQ